jgi:hypothetical protein
LERRLQDAADLVSEARSWNHTLERASRLAWIDNEARIQSPRPLVAVHPQIGASIVQQQIAVITLGIADLARSRLFYCEGFGWTPAFQNAEIVFYQMNGFVLGTWLTAA